MLGPDETGWNRLYTYSKSWPKQDKQILKWFRISRNTSVHNGPNPTETDLKYFPTIAIPYRYKGNSQSKVLWSGPPGIPPPGQGVNIYQFTINGQSIDAVEACEHYLTLIRRLVQSLSLSQSSEA